MKVNKIYDIIEKNLSDMFNYYPDSNGLKLRFKKIAEEINSLYSEKTSRGRRKSYNESMTLED